MNPQPPDPAVTAQPSRGAQCGRLSNGRWHFQHGPIDLVIGAEGDAHAVTLAHEAAWHRFRTLLGELVGELRALRLPIRGPCPLQGVVARRMWQACRPFHSDFITPMAAVAGSVAQEIVACYQGAGIDRAWVNNGGDIALHLAPGASVDIGLFADLSRLGVAPELPLDGRFRVDAAMKVRGAATSGWRGRSFSLGIADSVSVLARSAAMADAAATVIANAVDVADPCIERRPADSLKDDSDLGETLVTVAVPTLSPASRQAALQAGARRAHDLCRLGLIESALLVCQGAAASVAEGPDGRAEVRFSAMDAPGGAAFAALDGGRRAGFGAMNLGGGGSVVGIDPAPAASLADGACGRPVGSVFA